MPRNIVNIANAYLCIINKITLNLSSNFTLMEMQVILYAIQVK